jgi:hypothetical protein
VKFYHTPPARKVTPFYLKLMPLLSPFIFTDFCEIFISPGSSLENTEICEICNAHCSPIMEDEFNRLIKECEELIPDPIPEEYVSRKPIHKYIGLWSAGDCPLSSQYKTITEYNKAYSQ